MLKKLQEKNMTWWRRKTPDIPGGERARKAVTTVDIGGSNLVVMVSKSLHLSSPGRWPLTPVSRLPYTHLRLSNTNTETKRKAVSCAHTHHLSVSITQFPMSNHTYTWHNSSLWGGGLLLSHERRLLGQNFKMENQNHIHRHSLLFSSPLLNKTRLNQHGFRWWCRLVYGG